MVKAGLSLEKGIVSYTSGCNESVDHPMVEAKAVHW